MDIFTRAYRAGLIPVIKINDVKNALPLAKALIEGGLDSAEITFRTSCAAEAIKAIRAAYPQTLLGAGTVLNAETAAQAVEAGADFIVSPGFNRAVVEYCQKNNIPVIPGCSSPTDIEQALSYGLKYVKFFPAEAAGGLPMIKAMSAPYSDVKFMPTGGINEKNLCDYLAFNRIFACGGSFMVSEKLITAGKFDEITALSKAAVKQILGFSLVHIGINAADDAESKKSALLLCSMFDFEIRDLSISHFAGPLEIMSTDFTGEHGHIAIGTKSVDRAMYYLKKRGVEFDEFTYKADEQGIGKFVYLKDSVLGFAIHLLKI